VDVILYRARKASPVVAREVDRLVRELPDLKTFVVCYQPEYESARHSMQGSVYRYGQKDLHALPYPQKLSAIDWSDPKSRPPLEADSKKFFRAMEWGHQDLPVMKFFLDHPEFDRYWVIEDDVRYSGSWTDIMGELAQSSADLLMTVVQNYSEYPQWHWWKFLITGGEVLPIERRVRGFFPFFRVSAACLQSIDQKYRQGWGGHYEVSWPSIARASGLSIEDIGGEGSYTPPERRGRFYTCTSRNGSLFPGTFIYRPPLHDTGISEFAKDLTPHGMLWHPVKWSGGEDDPLNLALGKPALQSSVSPRYSIGHTPAEDANGGNNGDLSCDYGFHTATEPEPWWQVDLEDLFLLHRVVIFNRSNQAQRLNHFTVLGSSDGVEWTILFRKIDDYVFGQAGEPFVAEIPDEPSVRFVRVRLDGEAPLHFRECQVFGVHPNPEIRARIGRRSYVPLLNLALQKPALQSSVSPRFSIRHTPAEDAKGGNNGELYCDYGFHTAAEHDPWWQVDLEDSFLLHRILIFNRVSQADRLRRFTVLGSHDGVEWNILFRKTDDHVFGRASEPLIIEFADQPMARLVRIRLDGNAPLHFRECQIFGVHPDPQTYTRMERRNYVPSGRRGRVVEVGGFAFFVDSENYNQRIIEALERGDYEGFERQLVRQLITPEDRVIEVGTAIGSVAMTAASIVGAEGVVTFEANPDIANDARANFKRNGLEGIRSHVAILKNRRAITDPNEMKTFYIDKEFWGSRLNAAPADTNIIKTVQVPIACLEDVIESHRPTVLICDMEGAEVDLFQGAKLSGIRLIIVETHYWVVGEVATDEMVRELIKDGFSLRLGLSGFFRERNRRRVLVLSRPSGGNGAELPQDIRNPFG